MFDTEIAHAGRRLISVTARKYSGKARWVTALILVLLVRTAHASVAPGAGAGPKWLGPPPSAAPQRIVSLAPSTTEVLFALGAGSRVVAVTRYCDYPPETARLPKLGGVVDLNVEAVLATRPDLVVAMRSGASQQALERLAALGVPVLVVPSDALDDYVPLVSAIASAIGEPNHGAELVRTFTRDLETLRIAASREPPLRTLILVAERPLVAAGRGSFIEGAVATLGLVNVVDAGPFPEIGREDVVRRDPKLILDFTETGVQFPGKARVLRIKDPRLVRLSPRLPAALADLARSVRLP